MVYKHLYMCQIKMDTLSKPAPRELVQKSSLVSRLCTSDKMRLTGLVLTNQTQSAGITLTVNGI